MAVNVWLKRAGWFLAGALSFLVVVYFFGLENVDAILRTDLRFAALVFAAVVAVTMTSTLRLGSIANFIMRRKVLTFRQYYASLVMSRVIGLFLPRSASEVGVPFATLTAAGKTSPEIAAASITLDRVFDFALLLLWLVPILLILLEIVPPETGVLLFTLAGLAALIVMLRIHYLVRWAARVLSMAVGSSLWPRTFRNFCNTRSQNLMEASQISRLSIMQSTSMAGLTVCRYLINTALLFFIAQSLGLDISFYTLFLAGALMQLSQLFAITPGGLGIVEAGSASGLALAGVDGGEIAAFLVGQRVFQYVCFPALAGIVGLTMLWTPHRKTGSTVEVGG